MTQVSGYFIRTYMVHFSHLGISNGDTVTAINVCGSTPTFCDSSAVVCNERVICTARDPAAMEESLYQDKGSEALRKLSGLFELDVTSQTSVDVLF